MQENQNPDSFYEVFFKIAFYLSKFIIQLYIEYCCHAQARVHNCYLDVMDKLQKRIQRIVAIATFAVSLESFANRIVASLSFFYSITLVDGHLNWMNWCRFQILLGGPLVILPGCTIYLSPFLGFMRISMTTVSFLAQLDLVILCLQNVFFQIFIFGLFNQKCFSSFPTFFSCISVFQWLFSLVSSDSQLRK